jgi:hypothetical protein
MVGTVSQGKTVCAANALPNERNNSMPRDWIAANAFSSAP